jgi:Fibronectin type III-like domain
LQPNQKQTVELPLTTDAVAYWDIKLNKFVVEPGNVKVDR